MNSLCLNQLQQIRNNWSKLKLTNRLKSVIEQLIINFKLPWTVEEMIAFEEALPEYLK